MERNKHFQCCIFPLPPTLARGLVSALVLCVHERHIYLSSFSLALSPLQSIKQTYAPFLSSSSSSSSSSSLHFHPPTSGDMSTSPGYNGGYPSVAGDTSEPYRTSSPACESLRASTVGEDATRKKDRVLQLMLDQLQSTNSAASKVEDLVRHLRGSTARRAQRETSSSHQESDQGLAPHSSGYSSRIRQLEYDLQLQKDAHRLVVKDLQDQVLPAANGRCESLRGEMDAISNELCTLRDENAVLKKQKSHMEAHMKDLDVSLKTAMGLAEMKVREVDQMKEAQQSTAAATEAAWGEKLAAAEEQHAKVLKEAQVAAQTQLDEAEASLASVRAASASAAAEHEEQMSEEAEALSLTHANNIAQLRDSYDLELAQARADTARYQSLLDDHRAAADIDATKRVAAAEEKWEEVVTAQQEQFLQRIQEGQEQATSDLQDAKEQMCKLRDAHTKEVQQLNDHVAEAAAAHAADLAKLTADTNQTLSDARAELHRNNEGHKASQAKLAIEHEEQMTDLHKKAQELVTEQQQQVHALEAELLQLKDKHEEDEKATALSHTCALAAAEAAHTTAMEDLCRQHESSSQEAQEEAIRAVVEERARWSPRLRDMEISYEDMLAKERVKAADALSAATKAAEANKSEADQLRLLLGKQAVDAKVALEQRVTELKAAHAMMLEKEKQETAELVADVRLHADKRAAEAIRIHDRGEAAVREVETQSAGKLAEREAFFQATFANQQQDSEDRLRVATHLLAQRFEEDVGRIEEDARQASVQREEQLLRDFETLRIHDTTLAQKQNAAAADREKAYRLELLQIGEAMAASRLAIQEAVTSTRKKCDEREAALRAEHASENDKLRIRHGEICALRLSLEEELEHSKKREESATNRADELQQHIRALQEHLAVSQNAHRATEEQLAAEVASREAAEEESMQAAQRMAAAVIECERERRQATNVSPSSARTAPSASASPAETRHFSRSLDSGKLAALRNSIPRSPEKLGAEPTDAEASTGTHPQTLVYAETPEPLTLLPEELPPPPAPMFSEFGRAHSNCTGMTGNTARYERAMDGINLREGSLNTLESRTTSWVRDHPHALGSSVQSLSLKNHMLCTPSEDFHSETNPPLTALQLDCELGGFEHTIGTSRADSNRQSSATPRREVDSPPPRVLESYDDESSSELIAEVMPNLPTPRPDHKEEDFTASLSPSEEAQSERQESSSTGSSEDGLVLPDTDAEATYDPRIYPHPPVDPQVEVATPRTITYPLLDELVRREDDPTLLSVASQVKMVTHKSFVSLGEHSQVSSFVSVSDVSVMPGDEEAAPLPSAMFLDNDGEAEGTSVSMVSVLSTNMVSVEPGVSPRGTNGGADDANSSTPSSPPITSLQVFGHFPDGVNTADTAVGVLDG